MYADSLAGICLSFNIVQSFILMACTFIIYYNFEHIDSKTIHEIYSCNDTRILA